MVIYYFVFARITLRDVFVFVNSAHGKPVVRKHCLIHALDWCASMQSDGADTPYFNQIKVGCEINSLCNLWAMG